MNANFDQFQKFGKEQFEAAVAAASSIAKGVQAIATENTDYAKKSAEAGSAFVEKLLGVKTIEAAIQVQTDFAKASYEGFVAQTAKLGELYQNLAKEAFKPVEGAVAKVQAAAK